MSETKTHHIFCNGNPRSPVEGCRWCDGPKGMWARYPYKDESEVDALVAKHFPSAIPRSIPASRENR